MWSVPDTTTTPHHLPHIRHHPTTKYNRKLGIFSTWNIFWLTTHVSEGRENVNISTTIPGTSQIFCPIQYWTKWVKVNQTIQVCIISIMQCWNDPGWVPSLPLVPGQDNCLSLLSSCDIYCLPGIWPLHQSQAQPGRVQCTKFWRKPVVGRTPGEMRRERNFILDKQREEREQRGERAD